MQDMDALPKDEEECFDESSREIIEIKNEEAGGRIDRILAERYSDITRSYLQRLIKDASSLPAETKSRSFSQKPRNSRLNQNQFLLIYYTKIVT